MTSPQNKAHRLYRDSDLDLGEIADACGAHIDTVRAWCRKGLWQRLRNGRPWKQWYKDTKGKLLNLTVGEAADMRDQGADLAVALDGQTLTYLLRDVPLPMWRTFQDKCKSMGVSARARLLHLVDKDVRDRVL